MKKQHYSKQEMIKKSTLAKNKKSLTESKLSDLADKAKEDIRDYILMCKDREDKFSGKKSFELSNKFLIENLSNTYTLPENFLEELFTKVESELMDEGNSFWWKSEVWQESKTQNRKQRIKEDSLDDPDIDLSQSVKGKDLEFLKGYQNEVLDLMGEVIASELEEKGFKKVRFFSKDGYKLYSGGIFSKKVTEPGNRILLTIEIGEFGKIEADGVSYNAEDLANELCKAIEYYAPLLPVKIDAVYKAGNSGIDSAQWKIRLYHEVPEDILGTSNLQDSERDQVESKLIESNSNDELSSDEKSIVEEIIQADFESGLTSNDYESVLDMFKEDDVLSEKAEAATEYYFELLEYGPAGILEVITDNWSDDYLAEYGEFDDEDYYKDDDDPEEECYDHVEDGRADINSTADWYKISRIEGLIYDSQYKMTVEEAKAKLGIDPSFKYVPTGNLKHPSFEEL